MKSATIAVLATLLVLPAFGQELTVSDKYPLRAHIVSVEMQQTQKITDGTGGTSTWHLMKADINGTTYGLSIAFREGLAFRLRHYNWLEKGFYPARKAGCGFEFEYMDGGKIRHEELCIMAEEDTTSTAPAQQNAVNPPAKQIDEASTATEPKTSNTPDASSGFPNRWKSMTTGAICNVRLEGDYIYAEIAVSEADMKAGRFTTTMAKKDGNKYLGANHWSEGGKGDPSCLLSAPVEFTLVTPDRIEFRVFAPSRSAKLDWSTCLYPSAEWQSFVWIPVR